MFANHQSRENAAINFAHLVASYRQARGLSQGQLAQATRLSRTYIYHLETGQRANPSPHVVRNIARVLELGSEERRRLFDTYSILTGQWVDIEEGGDNALLDMGDLASLLVHNTSYPAHALDRLWYLYAWNTAATTLFGVQEPVEGGERLHLLKILFDPQVRGRFHGWENLARRLVSDFQYLTATVPHLQEYKTLLRELREMPEFKRIAGAVYPHGRPSPSFVFQVQHNQLGRLTLRTATTNFTGVTNYSLVSYVPGDQQTLKIYREQGWQPAQ
jgi:transcriptional regulator with XRE-family HTH domain